MGPLVYRANGTLTANWMDQLPIYMYPSGNGSESQSSHLHVQLVRVLCHVTNKWRAQPIRHDIVIQAAFLRVIY